MSLLLLAKLAWRNLWRNYRRTLIMLAAIILGVWAMILMNALMRGMVDGVLDSGLKYLPGHAQLHHPAYREDPGVAHSLGALSAPLQEALTDRDIRGWSARVKVPAMISSERDSRGVVLLGVDPVQEVSIGFAVADVVQGRFLESAADPSVVVGEAMLKRLETRLGRRIVLSSQTVENEVGRTRLPHCRGISGQLAQPGGDRGLRWPRGSARHARHGRGCIRSRDSGPRLSTPGALVWGVWRRLSMRGWCWRTGANWTGIWR